jgi:hypothetical protein
MSRPRLTRGFRATKNKEICDHNKFLCIPHCPILNHVRLSSSGLYQTTTFKMAHVNSGMDKSCGAAKPCLSQCSTLPILHCSRPRNVLVAFRTTAVQIALEHDDCLQNHRLTNILNSMWMSFVWGRNILILSMFCYTIRFFNFVRYEGFGIKSFWSPAFSFSGIL